MRLTDVLGAIMELVAVPRGAASPRVSARDEVIAIFGPRIDEGASLVLGMVMAEHGWTSRLALHRPLLA